MLDMINLIKQLCALGHRQLQQETAAFELLVQLLDQAKINYATQTYATFIPDFKSATLVADGMNIDAVATSFVSGEINGKDNLVSSLISSQPLIDTPNLNFNPACLGISRSNHYFAPSVAIAAKDVSRICAAKVVNATVVVGKTPHQSCNILVGNTTRPKNILICHVDSVGPGATDNAAGVAVLMKLVTDYPELLSNNLFVFAGNEELSYDYPVYWGHGYRVFEQEYGQQLAQANNILVVDCVGNGPTTFSQDPHLVHIGFPLSQAAVLKEKITMVYGDFDRLMAVYQSDLDVPEVLVPEALVEAVQALLGRISGE